MFQNRGLENMDKKIGKLLLVLCFITTTLFGNQAVRLYTQDLKQNPIRQAEKSVPFILQIVADNIEGPQRPSDIQGFDDFDVTEYGSSQSTTIVNGQKSQRVTYNYVLKGDKVGSFKIGPVEIKDRAGKVIASEVLRIRVGDQVVAHTVKKQPYFLQVDVDKKSLYVGQELFVKIRFYYIDDFQSLRIVKPDLDEFSIDAINDKPLEGIDKINGDEYHYQEWTLKAYPEKVGTLIIPPFQAVFMMPANFQQGLLGLFDVFSMSSERVVQASPRSIDVQALPVSEKHKDVTAVGQFNKASFAVGKKEADVGEGVVATFKVVGIGNIESFKAPVLTLPDGLRYYESNSSVKKIDDTFFEKTFEYILQGDRAGDFEISQQTFTYFDIQNKDYKSLKTNAVQVTMLSSEITPSKTEEAKEDQQTIVSSQSQSKYAFKDNQVDFVHESGWMHEDSTSIVASLLPWLLMLFGWLSLLALLYWVYCLYIGIKVTDLYWVYYLMIRIQVLQVARRQDIQGLYQLYYGMGKRYGFDLQSEDIVRYFKDTGKSKEYIEKWHTFVTSLMHVIFSSEKNQKRMRLYVMSHAVYWVRELLQYCRFLHSNSKTSIS